jgi:hypothetical protein
VPLQGSIAISGIVEVKLKQLQDLPKEEMQVVGKYKFLFELVMKVHVYKFVLRTAAIANMLRVCVCSPVLAWLLSCYHTRQLIFAVCQLTHARTHAHICTRVASQGDEPNYICGAKTDAFMYNWIQYLKSISAKR